MFTSLVRLAKSGKLVMVICESMSGTGHKVLKIRAKQGDKLEFIRWDPWVQEKVLYKEVKKKRTIR